MMFYHHGFPGGWGCCFPHWSVTKNQKIARMEEYKKYLEEEMKAVEEAIKEIKEQKD